MRPSSLKARYSQDLIQETLSVWQPFYDRPLTEADAEEIIKNMTEFATALLRPDFARPRAETLSKSDKSLA